MIKLVRVDHRLLHGQVIFSWTKQVGTNYIIVAMIRFRMIRSA